jgi:hypothetical protein
MGMPPTISRERSAELHEQLRQFLLAVMGQESPITIASALMYEVASLAASMSRSKAEADELVESLIDGAQAQIAAFGVGRPHP